MRCQTTTIAAAFALLASISNAAPQIHADVHRALREKGEVNIMITMKGSMQTVLDTLEHDSNLPRGTKIEKMVDALQSHAEESQQSLKELVEKNAKVQEGTKPNYDGYKSFWISNQVYISRASSELIEQLSTLSSVKEVRKEIIIPLEDTIEEESIKGSAVTELGLPPFRALKGRNLNSKEKEIPDYELQGTEWGVKLIQAPSVWQDGILGQGVIVGTIDSGARVTHEAIARNYRGEYGWYDPATKSPVPFDDLGHGTHVIGTIAGGKGVGVAPGATWMACRACIPNVGCPWSDLLACAQFIACPHNVNGTDADCSKAPHIVSNSWGGESGDPYFSDAVAVWLKAGIIPVFSNGNHGPGCATAGSPGDYPNVISVGAMAVNETLGRFSSRGPGLNGVLKPDLSAPGVKVRSSWIGDDKDYKAISGTSMACPHVSGAVALLLSANPSLKYDDIYRLLTQTTDQNVVVPVNQTCGNTGDLVWPNNQYGHGRLNVFNAYEGYRPTPTPEPTPIPTSTPTPAPTPKPSPFCAIFTKKFVCNLVFICDWDPNNNICDNRF